MEAYKKAEKKAAVVDYRLSSTDFLAAYDSPPGNYIAEQVDMVDYQQWGSNKLQNSELAVVLLADQH